MRVINADTYNNIVSNPSHYSPIDPTSELQEFSREVKYLSPTDQTTYMNNVYTTGNAQGNGTGAEFMVPMIFDGKNATLGFGPPQPKGNIESATLNYTSWRGNAYLPGDQPTRPGEVGKVIVGVAHPHPEPGSGKTLISFI